MLRPFPLVIIAALGLVTLKVAGLIYEEPKAVISAQYDQIVTGSINNRQRLQPAPILRQDDVFIRALSSLPAKEAARVFGALEAETQAEIAPRLSATLFGDILSQLPPEKAEKLALLLGKQHLQK